MEEKIKSPTTEEATLSLVDKKPLEIFKTKADLTGRDITQMSNFFDGYIEQMSLALREESAIEVLSEIPISDLSIVNEVVQTARVLLKDNVTLVPDFDNLPLDIKKKLKLGLYTISESKQVEGNMRAVILDENGTRVKDITLKKVVSSPENLETARNIGNQLQVKQIYAKLAAIEEFQTYQIKRDRDQQIIVPFLDARTLIIRAANAKSADEQKNLLEQANSKITSALHSIYTDMDTSAKMLAKKADSWFPDITGRMNDYMRFITSDLQIATKYVGVSMQILEYIGDNSGAKNALLDIFLCEEDLYDGEILFQLKSFTILGLYVFCALKDYNVLGNFSDLQDISLKEEHNMRDLSFMANMSDWFMLFIQGASLPNLDPLMHTEGFKKNRHSYCLGLYDCHIKDTSSLINSNLHLYELLIWNKWSKFENER